MEDVNADRPPADADEPVGSASPTEAITIDAEDERVVLEALARLVDSAQLTLRAVEINAIYRRRSPWPRWSRPRGCELALSHAALNARGQGQTTTYLRGLLVAAGVLPDEDPVLVLFERWLMRRLDWLAEHPHQQVLRQFGLWHQLPRMRAKAARRRLPAGANSYARGQFKAAQSFLTWLVTAGLSLANIRQADLERWFVVARPVTATAAAGSSPGQWPADTCRYGSCLQWRSVPALASPNPNGWICCAGAPWTVDRR